MRFDESEVNALAIDLSKAPGRAQRRAPKVFARGAHEIHRGMKREASGHRYLKQLQSHVGYDRIGELSYEIGFNKVGQGNLANIAAFGSINNAPVMDITAPLRRELPQIIRHLADLGEESVLGGDRDR